MAMSIRLARALATPALAALALAACATVPSLGPRPSAKPAAAYETAQSFAAPTADWPSDRWWDSLGDPQLSDLIDEGLKGAPSLAEARARLRAAQAAEEQSRAATLPTLSFNGQVETSELSREQGFPPFIQQQLPKGYHGAARATLDASYDLDLFGKNRAALAAAVSESAAARADAAQARLTLSTAIAQAYGDLARLTAEREAAVEALRNRTDTRALTAQRVESGIDTQAELKQAEAAVPAAQADLDAIDELVLVTRHRLAALVGEGPDRGLAIAAPKTGAVGPLALPPDLAVNLVSRRPDLVAARLRAEAAARRIDSAKAAFYPNITLTAFIGQQTLGLGNFFNPAAAIGQFGPAVSLPIFDGGRLAGAYRGARANYDAAVADYDATLTAALQDVADSATSVQSAGRQLAERRDALSASQAAYQVARLRYEGGLSAYVSVLSAEDQLIIARRASVDADARAFQLDIALIRALGGGFAGV